MATVITTEPLRGSGTMPRASVNGLQFIDAETLTGGGRMPDTRIGSSTAVHTVLDWTPDADSDGLPVGGPITANFKADNTAELPVEFDEAADFNDGGTHDDTETVGDEVKLQAQATGIDFEDYIVNQWLYTDVHPDDWTHRGAASGHAVRDRLDPVNRLIEGKNYNSKTTTTHDDTGDVAAGVVYSKMYFPSMSWYQRHGLGFLLTGSGTVLHGYALTIQVGQTTVRPYRITSQTAWSGMGLSNLGFTILANTWYHFKIHFWHDETSAYYQWKCWKDGDAEPGSYTWGGSDTVYPQDGAVGLCTICTTNEEICYFDQFEFDADDPVFESSGAWTSDPIDVTPAETFSSGIVTFDKTTPADTTAELKARWTAGAAWLLCTSGQPLPGISYKDDMRAGSNKDALEFKIELATTAPTSSPALSNIAVFFDPCRFEDITLDVDGRLATIENAHLVKWGKRQVDTGVEIIAYDDLTVQAHTLDSYRLHGESIEAIFKYAGVRVDSLIFAQLQQAFRQTRAADSYFAISFGAIETHILVEWNLSEIWTPAFHSYQWILIDKTQGIHADAWYWVGHVRRDDHPGSMVAAIPELSDHLGSLIAKGYARDDHPGSSLVQGWRRDDLIGSLLPALQKMDDFLGMTIVAIAHQTDAPGSLLVYGVNRHNEIEIHTVTADTVTELEAAGFVFPPEAT